MAEAQSKIIGGKVTFGLTVCPKQYESKRVDVEIAFTVREDDSYEAIFDKACKVAQDRAREMVDLHKPPRQVATRRGSGSAGLFGDEDVPF